MEHQPVISIVLPTYNGSKYIRASIDSCLNQTFKDFELIIVNDCSSDNTASIIEEYAAKDNRIAVIHNAFNKKLPLSLNTGFDVAKGKYHTWTSDDNYYAPDALQILLQVMEHNDIDFVYTDYTIINDANEITGKRTFGDINQNFTNFQGSSACFLYKAEVHKANNGFNPSAFLIEDYDFFVRAFLKFKVLYVNRYDLYYYREHPSSLTSVHSDAVNDIAKIMMERQMSNLAEKLPSHQLALLYRKFAVFNAVQKNNSYKYKLYLERLWKVSKKQMLITIFYVPLMKLWKAFTVSITGFTAFIKLLFK
jgi:glycosyltransferase involved in cell wall biosynthesis